jgi:hypothetical protein
MIRKLSSGKYRLYSRKANTKTGRRRNLGTFTSRAAAQKHEKAVQFFKRHRAPVTTGLDPMVHAVSPLPYGLPGQARQ